MASPSFGNHAMMQWRLRPISVNDEEGSVNNDAKKAVLRMIPYGIYILTADAKGSLAAASDGKLSGQPYRSGATGAPLLIDAVGAIECRVTAIVEQGDHHIVVGEVVEAHLNKPLSGRPDAAILEMKDLGDNVFYGG
jgi:flavin reductase (DIM6/NTAB) family NADH-FMN oxidoreductase RutF